MKNLYLLPTDISRLHLAYDNEWYVSNEAFSQLDTCNYKSFNIYITNNEGIEKGEYYIHGNRLHKHLGKKCLDVLTNKEYPQSRFIKKDLVFKKVILTTDQDLIKNGVQAIDDEFLEWFVKNPSCEKVDVTNVPDFIYETKHSCYKITIPKEEIIPEQIWNDEKKEGLKEFINKHKQETLENPYLFTPKPLIDISRMKLDNHPDLHKQETLEEASFRFYPEAEQWTDRHIFTLGAKWQQERGYSEEEVYNITQQLRLQLKAGVLKWQDDFEFDLEKWFEKFKKK